MHPSPIRRSATRLRRPSVTPMRSTSWLVHASGNAATTANTALDSRRVLHACLKYRRNSVTPGVTPAESVAAVRAEIARLPDRGQGRPGLDGAAVKLAELLDDRWATPEHPAAAGPLRELLAELRESQAVAGTGKLAQLRVARHGPPGM